MYRFFEEKKELKKITAIRGHGIFIERTCRKYWFCKVQYYKTTVKSKLLLLMRKKVISIILKMSLSVVQTKQEDRL